MTTLAVRHTSGAGAVAAPCIPAAELHPDVFTGAPLRVREGLAVWTVRLDQDSDCETALATWLSVEERARAAAFRFSYLRRRFTVCRGAVRLLLGEVLGVAPSSVPLAQHEFGKPYVCGTDSRVRFNVSHSDRWALVAIDVDGREVGVDLERIVPLPDLDALVRSVFSPGEQAEFQGLCPEDRLRAFFNGWTRKEAFIKATGRGVQQSLTDFDVTLAPGAPTRLLRVTGDELAAGRWELADLPVVDGFAAAVCIARAPVGVA